MSRTDLFRVGADIPIGIRAELLDRFPARFPTIWADTITVAYRVTSDYAFPTEQLTCTVFERVETNCFDALRIGIGPLMHRADGSYLSLLLSTEPGLPRKETILPAKLGAPDYHQKLYTFPLRLRRLPVHVLSPRPSLQKVVA